MAAASDYLETNLRTLIFRTGAGFTKTANLSIALCTAATADTHTGATIPEVTNANGYARVSMGAPLDATWTAASGIDGLTDNAAAITFPACITAAWGIVTNFAICDSATWGAGNVLFHGALTTFKPVNVGDVFSFAIGALDITID